MSDLTKRAAEYLALADAVPTSSQVDSIPSDAVAPLLDGIHTLAQIIRDLLQREAELVAECERMQNELDQERAYYFAARAECARLRKALLKYGSHINDGVTVCDVLLRPAEEGWPCNCGFDSLDAAMPAAPQTGAEHG